MSKHSSPVPHPHHLWLILRVVIIMQLNVNNKAAQIERLTDYTFADKLLAAEAAQMAAPQVAVIYGSFRGLPNNKRLSVLGDAVLTKALCGLWFNVRGRRGKFVQTIPSPAIPLM